MLNKMMEKVQRFGGAMYSPVLLLTFAGIMVGISTVFQTTVVMGDIAAAGTNWQLFWATIKNGTNALMQQLPMLFMIGLPIGLAKKENARCCLEAFVTYMTFNYFINGILSGWGSSFGVDFAANVGGTSGLAMICSVKTLDTGVLGALIISGITVAVHNKYFDKPLPDWLGVFRGSSLVCVITFFLMLPVALVFCLVWPQFQHAINGFQNFMKAAGSAGVGIYAFLEALLIPTGLHHFIYTPFLFDAAAVEGGIRAYWAEHLSEFAMLQVPLKEAFSAGGFSLFGMKKVFAPLGISLAFIATAKPEKRQATIARMIPVALTATLCGITEPLEFTFLFASPILFVVHAFLCGCMNAVAYGFGVVGEFSSGLLQWIPLNWIPLGKYQWPMYVKQIAVGLCFTVIWFVVFRFMILKFNFKTPGREDSDDIKLLSKKEYKALKNSTGAVAMSSMTEDQRKAAAFLIGLGGAENVVEVNNCATRLRVSVKDKDQVKDDDYFKAHGAHGVVHRNTAFQVIVGLSVPNVRSAFEEYMKNGIPGEERLESELETASRQVVATQSGKAVALEDVPDQVFSGKMLGDGIAVLPEDNMVVSPVKGEIIMIAETKHAYGIRTEDGVEFIVHIGLDTVGLEGKGFDPLVKAGDQVDAGTPICQVADSVKNSVKNPLYTPIIITNMDKVKNLRIHTGKTEKGKTCIMEYDV